MYNILRTGRYFREELETFIEAAKKDAKVKRVPSICCPCKRCKNTKVLTDPITIRSHVIVDGFVQRYFVWIHHGFKEVVPPGDELIGDDVDDTDTFFDADLNMVDQDQDEAKDHDEDDCYECITLEEDMEDTGGDDELMQMTWMKC